MSSGEDSKGNPSLKEVTEENAEARREGEKGAGEDITTDQPSLTGNGDKSSRRSLCHAASKEGEGLFRHSPSLFYGVSSICGLYCC